MKVFCDTSALLKLYHDEKGSFAVAECLSRGTIDGVCLAEITKVEFCSAIWKKIRSGGLSQEAGFAVIEIFSNNSSDFEWIRLNEEIVELARTKVLEYGKMGLRTLDSIQLAAGISARISLDSNLTFLTTDQVLYAAFLKENVKPLLTLEEIEQEQ